MKPKCAICIQPPEPHSKLCSACNQNRLGAASQARIMGRTGLTRSNVEAFSEENWIKTDLLERQRRKCEMKDWARLIVEDIVPVIGEHVEERQIDIVETYLNTIKKAVLEEERARTMRVADRMLEIGLEKEGGGVFRGVHEGYRNPEGSYPKKPLV